MNTRRFPRLAPLLLALVSVLALAAPALAVDYYLCAGAATVTMPDGVNIPMWGYALDDDNDLGNGCGGAVQVPGPRLTVPVGDNALRIFLRNDLPDPDGVGPQSAPPTSVVIAGLPMPEGSAPQRHTAGPFAGRVRSFTLEAAPGGQRTYTWSNVKPGTYVYQSGTHQQVQVQMGLSGAVSKDAAAGEAYAASQTSPAVAYTKQHDLFFSEIDPALHAAVATGTYGTPGGPTSTLSYKPKYFLINGQPFSGGGCIGGLDIGDNVLLRLYNAGLRELAPMMLGSHVDVAAEGGNKYPFRYTRYSVLLPPGSTKDLVFSPARNGQFPILERRLNLTNAATPNGGMQVCLAVGPQPPTATTDSYAVAEGETRSIAAPGVLANDSNFDAASGAVLVTGPASASSFTLNADGSFSYTHNGSESTSDSFVYRISNANGTAQATVTVAITAVNDAPVAANDSYTTVRNTPLTVSAPGVLGNDTDADGNPLAVATTGTVATSPAGSGSVTRNANGSFTYTPAAGYTGPATFTYQATDGTAPSSVATVTVAVTAPTNVPPVANSDSYTTAEDTPLTVNAAGVLGNDTDADGNPLTVATTGTVATSPAGSGSVTRNANGSFTYTPALNFFGAATFTYQATDGTDPSNVATATITVTANPNDPPVSVPDTYSTPQNTPLTVPAPGVLANDSDPDGQPLTAQLRGTPVNGTVTLNANGSFTFTPTAGFTGIASFQYRARSAADTLNRNGNQVTVTINVTGTGNNPPVANADSYTTAEDTPLALAAPGVLSNDSDPDGQPLSVGTTGTAATSPAGSGSVTRNANGSFTYTPAANFSGTATFTYQASDGTAVSNVATASITVTPVNDAPAFTSTPVTTAAVGAPYSYDANAADPEGSALTFALTQAPAGMTIDATTGVISWTPAAGQTGANPVTLQVTDSGTPLPALSATQSFTVAVSAAGTLPDGLVLAYNFEEGTGTTVINRVTPGTVNGTINGAARVATGRYGAALSFDGVNDRVDAPDSNVVDLTTGMTLTAWVNPSALGSIWRTVILKETASGLAYSLYASDGTAGPSLPAGYVRIGTADQGIQSPGTLPTGTWSHLAVTYGGGSLTLYVNGAQVATRAQAGTVTTSASPLRIGGNAIWGEYFQGLIDETRIYNRALTPAEIVTDMNTPIP